MPPARCMAEIAAMTHMMTPMTSKGMPSAVTGAPARLIRRPLRPPAKPIAIDPSRARSLPY